MYLREARRPTLLNEVLEKSKGVQYDEDFNPDLLVADAIDSCVEVTKTVSIEVVNM